MLSGWLYLIIGPVYWQTRDAQLAFQVGLAAAFIGGMVEVAGGFAGRWIINNVPNCALMGNMASSAMVWLSIGKGIGGKRTIAFPTALHQGAYGNQEQ